MPYLRREVQEVQDLRQTCWVYPDLERETRAGEPRFSAKAPLPLHRRLKPGANRRNFGQTDSRLAACAVLLLGQERLLSFPDVEDAEWKLE